MGDTSHSRAQGIYQRIVRSGLLHDSDTAYIFYSRQMLVERLNVLKQAFDSLAILHTVAIKTNPHPAVLSCIVEQGLGLEAASFEEVLLAVSAGAPFNKIVYNSPVKTRKELEYCAHHLPGICINANSIDELERIPSAESLKVGLRINPLVQPSTDMLYNVSREDSKFGVPIFLEEDILKAVFSGRISTIHIHVGSRIETPEILLEALQKTVRLCDKINTELKRAEKPFMLTGINFGGGLSALRNIEASNDLMTQYGKGVREIMINADFRYSLTNEFGQWVHLHNGFAYSRVEYVRSLKEKNIAFLHLGADFFPREIYSPHNALNFEFYTPNGETRSGVQGKTDLAGPLCFNGDYLSKDLEAPALSEGDIVAIPSVGANTFGLWSRHCSRTIPTFFSEKMDNPSEIENISSRFNPFVNLAD